MPAIWASSERPLFVRTVWVDGMRHAILSPDDPVVNSRLRQRPQTSKEESYPTKPQQIETKLNHLSNCFMNLHVVVENSFPDNKNIVRFTRRQSAPPRTRISTEKTEGILEIYVNNIDKSNEDIENCRILGEEEPSSPIDDSVSNFNTNTEQTCSQQDMFSTTTEYKQINATSEVQWNPLSERVLQWLDLSGKAQDYEFEIESKPEDDRRWNSVKRRRYLSRRQDISSLAEKERTIMQNYKLQKNCKLEHMTKIETKFARMGLSKRKSTMKDEMRKKENIAYILSEASKDQVSSNIEKDILKNESQNNLLTVLSPPGRLQLHIVMPSFNSAEKCTSSLESLTCD